jgi:hypothetical protein
MKDFVSRRWIVLAALVSWAVLACAILGPLGFGWTSLAAVILGAALGVVTVLAIMAMRASRSIAEVLHDVEAEPALAAALPARLRPAGAGSAAFPERK